MYLTLCLYLNAAGVVWREREAFAIVHSVQKLRPYLYGAKYTIYCDHKPLKSVFTKQMNNTRMQRWAILLAETNAEINYHPGKLNCRADKCSRIVTPPSINVIDADADWIDPLAFPEQNIAETLPLEHDGLDLTEIGIQKRAAVIPVSNYILIQDVICIKRPSIYVPEIPRLLLPQRYRDKGIDRAHKEVGHLSYATVTRIAEAYVWPLMRQPIRDPIAKCTTCSVHSRRTYTVVQGRNAFGNKQNVFSWHGSGGTSSRIYKQ